MNAPIPYTCPAIDEVISTVADAIRELESVEDKMEDLRKANASLREWGEEQEDRADDTEAQAEEIKELRDQVENLEEELDEKDTLLARKDAEIESLTERLIAADAIIQPSLTLGTAQPGASA